MATALAVPRVSIATGVTMPLFGLGTFLSSANGECKAAVSAALARGYRLVDTAAMYENEEDVGAALAEGFRSGLTRDDVFVVTKLIGEDHGADRCGTALQTSLKKLGLDSVDLYLIHTPKGGKIVETWNELRKLRDRGLTRAIGVSNFGVEQLEGLKKACPEELPAVNQIELHPWLQQRPTTAWCKANGVTIMGYCPLARCKQFGSTPLAAIATRLGRSEADVCLRWSVQSGVVTIPKSVNPERVVSNAAVAEWELSDGDMAEVALVDCGFKASMAVERMDIPWEQVSGQ